MHFLHHCSPFRTPSSVAHIDCHAMRSGCVMFNRALDTLLMHHVSLGIIRVVTKRPSELLGLNQKHTSRRRSDRLNLCWKWLSARPKN
jgi:hypothetical protein